MLIKIALIALILIIAVLIYAATRPDTFHVERSVTIKAPPEKIFPLINDFHLWNDWTPYNKDPAMQKTFSGSPLGVGAHYAWEGNKEVGQGEISITEATPPTRVVLNLHIIKPFEGGNNPVVFTLKPADGHTNVTWAMDGQSHFMFKVMGLFISMDNMIGKDFEVGLAQLKVLAEK